jgi:hypothetical protein
MQLEAVPIEFEMCKEHIAAVRAECDKIGFNRPVGSQFLPNSGGMDPCKLIQGLILKHFVEQLGSALPLLLMEVALKRKDEEEISVCACCRVEQVKEGRGLNWIEGAARELKKASVEMGLLPPLH